MTDNTQDRPTRIEIALDYVTRATTDLDTAARQRLYYWGLARQYGATYRQIADASGLTDAAIRLALQRQREQVL